VFITRGLHQQMELTTRVGAQVVQSLDVSIHYILPILARYDEDVILVMQGWRCLLHVLDPADLYR
jgi:hypothetical protein